MQIKNTSRLLIAGVTLALSPMGFAKVSGPLMLNIDGIGTSEVLAWSWGASQSGSFHVGGGGGAGKTNFQDISLTRYSDAMSGQILAAVATGNHWNRVDMERDGLRIRLENVLVSSYSVGGMADKKDLQTENVTLNFAIIRYEVSGGPEYCFNIAENSAC